MLVERRSRVLVLLPNPDRRPAGVAQRIQAALGGLFQDLRVTVTFDRGFEFMGYPALGRGLAPCSRPCATPGRAVPATAAECLEGRRALLGRHGRSGRQGRGRHAGGRADHGGRA